VANYKLIDPANAANFVTLWGVTEDQFTHDREREILVVIGRGKKVNYGTDLGMVGSLTVKIRERAGSTSSAQRDALEAFLVAHPDVILESPWGDQWHCDIGPFTVTRIAGTGDSEAVDISFTYEELDADV
jgi:hypothetical protein